MSFSEAVARSRIIHPSRENPEQEPQGRFLEYCYLQDILPAGKVTTLAVLTYKTPVVTSRGLEQNRVFESRVDLARYVQEQQTCGLPCEIAQDALDNWPREAVS